MKHVRIYINFKTSSNLNSNKLAWRNIQHQQVRRHNPNLNIKLNYITNVQRNKNSLYVLNFHVLLKAEDTPLSKYNTKQKRDYLHMTQIKNWNRETAITTIISQKSAKMVICRTYFQTQITNFSNEWEPSRNDTFLSIMDSSCHFQQEKLPPRFNLKIIQALMEECIHCPAISIKFQKLELWQGTQRRSKNKLRSPT